MRWFPFTVVGAVASSAFGQDPLYSQLSPIDSNVQSSDAPSYRSELLSLHKDLIRTPSISGDEEAVGEYLYHYLTDRAYDVLLMPVEPRESTPKGKERFNLLAWKGESGIYEGPRVLVSSHIDVVPPHIEYGRDPGDITKDTKIWGRGSADAKGSVAAQIIALEELIRQEKIDPLDVGLLFVVGEEVAGDGMQAFSQFLRDESRDRKDPHGFDAVIFGEPTENKLACGHKGALFCDIHARGVGGHSGYPWLGKSANELMVRALGRIIETDLGSSDAFGNTTVNIGKFDGGVAANVIAEAATVSLAVRVAIGPQKEGGRIVQEKIQAILDEVDEEAFDFQCGKGGYGSVACDCDVKGFDTIVVNYGTDVPNLIGNHTRYLYGPGTILVAHGPRENVTVGDLEASVEGYQRLILHALKSSSGSKSQVSEEL